MLYMHLLLRSVVRGNLCARRTPGAGLVQARAWVDAESYVSVPLANGSVRMRLPEAAKTALLSAGPIGGTPGSPTPVGFSVEGTMWTSTIGISSMRSTWQA